MNQTQSSRHVLIVEEPSFRKTVILEEATYSLGRHSSNDIIITSQKISRNHATLLRRTDVKTDNYSYWILDGDLQGNRSRNGIYINGKKCLVHELKHGDVIKLSRDIQATYHALSNLETSQINSQYNHVSSEKEVESLQGERKITVNRDTAITSYKKIKSSSSSELLRLSSFAELSPQAIIEIDFNGNITYANSQARIIFKDLYKKGTTHPFIAGLYEGCNINNVSLTREIKIKKNYYRQKAYYLADNRLIRSYISDLTQEKTLEAKLEEKVKQYDYIFEHSAHGIIIIDAKTRKIIEINQAACEYLKANESDCIDNEIENFIIKKEEFLSLIQIVTASPNNYTASVGFQKTNAELLDTELNLSLLNLETNPKICLILKQQNNLKLNSSTNIINNFPSIEVLKEKTDLTIAQSNYDRELLAILAIEIGNFTNIENAITKEQKVILLSNFAERLKACLRFADTVAYEEQNKFFVLMEDIATIQEIAKISQKILDSLQQIFKIGKHKLNIIGKIGIAVYPQNGTSCDSLLENANLTLERISEEKNGCYQFHNSTMNSQSLVLLKLESFLHNALEKDEFILYYQPQVNVNSGSIQGVEALLRWQHPELGLVAPNSFIGIAEQTGLIVSIGKWVLKTACQQNKLWHSQGFLPLRVSVNLSPIQFQQPDLPLIVKQILIETELEPHFLELEIAANIVVDNLSYSSHILSQLQQTGVHISLNDFNIGNISWQKLKNIPFDTLKINRDFVRQLKNDPQDLAIISEIVAKARDFNLRVVAEGVETQQQIELLKSQECEQMQGFWFSRPLAVEEATKLLPFNCME